MRKLKPLLLFSLLIIVISTGVLAKDCAGSNTGKADFEFPLPCSSYTKTIEASESYTTIFNAASQGECYEDDWGLSGYDDYCFVKTFTVISPSVATCKKVYSNINNDDDDSNKVQCKGLSSGTTQVDITVRERDDDGKEGLRTLYYQLTVTATTPPPPTPVVNSPPDPKDTTIFIPRQKSILMEITDFDYEDEEGDDATKIGITWVDYNNNLHPVKEIKRDGVELISGYHEFTKAELEEHPLELVANPTLKKSNNLYQWREGGSSSGVSYSSMTGVYQTIYSNPPILSFRLADPDGIEQGFPLLFKSADLFAEISYFDYAPVWAPFPNCGDMNTYDMGYKLFCPLAEEFQFSPSNAYSNQPTRCNYNHGTCPEEIVLSEYCDDDNAVFEITHETNPEVIDCELTCWGIGDNSADGDCPTITNSNYWSVPTNKLICNPIDNAFGTNNITIECSDGINTPATQILSLVVENVFDRATVTDESYSIGISRSSTKTFEFPISNPDKFDLETYIAMPSTNQLGSVTDADISFDSDTGAYSFEFTASDTKYGTGFFKYGFKNPGEVFEFHDIDVNVPEMNDPPVCSSGAEIKERYILEDGDPYTFNSREINGEIVNDFEVCYDPNQGDSVVEIIIDTLIPGIFGTLKYNDEFAYRGLTIPVSELNKLVFTPKLDGHGKPYTSFNFSGSDGILWSEPVKMILNVRSVNDNPEIGPISNMTLTEDIGSEKITIYLEDFDETDTLTLSAEIPNDKHSIINPSLIRFEGQDNNIKDMIIVPSPNAYGEVPIKITVSDGNRGESSVNFIVSITPENDAPTAKDFGKEVHVYGTISFSAEDFGFEDIDSISSDSIAQLHPSNYNFTKLKVYAPKEGSLVNDGEVIEWSTEIDRLNIPKLSFEMDTGITGSTTFQFSVSDANSYSDIQTATMTILPSPFGDLSQPRSRGGVRILQTDWSCKPGYTPDASGFTMQTIFEAGEVCVKMENELPTADLVAPEIVQIGDVAFFSAGRSADPDGIIKEYIWELSSNVIKTGEKVHHIYNSVEDCTSGICNIKLTVIDSDGDNTTANTTLTLTTDEIDGPDYFGLIMSEGQNYTDDELTYLGLLKGQMNLKGDEEVTVDTTGMITSIEEQIVEFTEDGLLYESYIPNDGQCQTGERESSTPLDCLVGDGICSKSLGEHSLNSPDDCKGNSKMGAILLLAFLTLLGGGAFFAWKKGLLGKYNLSLGAKPAADASPFETTQPVQPSGPEQYIKTQRAKGFSNEQIRGALKNKGWEDDKIDEALNASRE